MTNLLRKRCLFYGCRKLLNLISYRIVFLIATFLLASSVNASQPTATASLSVISASTEINLEVAALRAQLETTKQFQDSFLSMAQWTLGSAIAVALALGAFAWHTNKTNYERDKESIQREARALATELRAEMLSQFQAELKRLDENLGEREKTVREAVENSLDGKLSAIGSKIREIESEALDLKEKALEGEAEESVKHGNFRWAVRTYCKLLDLHVKRGFDEYFAADILDELRSIAKNPAADLDAEAVTRAVSTLSNLPARHHAVTEPLITLLKQKLA